MTLGRPVLEKRADLWSDVVMVPPSDQDTSVRHQHPSNGINADLFTARLTIDVTPPLRGSSEIPALQWGMTHMLRELPSGEFNVNPGNPK
jgi:hypothetical protein